MKENDNFLFQALVLARELFLISLFLKIYLLRSMDRAEIRVKVWRAGIQKVHVMMR